MEPNKRERFTDELLDAALRQYGSVEPRAGLEQRVLVGVRAKENETTSPWWKLQWMAGAAAAVVILVLGIYLALPKEAPVKTPVIAEEQPAPPPTAAPPREAPVVTISPRATARATARRPPQRAVVAGAPAHVKLDVFPAPSAITEEERVALFYARRAPQEALLAAAAKANQPLASIHIEEIQVAPLAEPPGTQENPQDGIQK